MKRWIAVLFALLFCACSASPQPEAQIAAPEPTVTPVPTATPTPVPTDTPTPAPTATPSPSPTPSGLCGGRFPDRFSDTPELTETGYRSSGVGIEIRRCVEPERYAGFNVIYYVADIYVQDVTSIRTAPAFESFKNGYERTPAEIAESVNALLAMTGDTYVNLSSCILVRNGETYRDKLTPAMDLCVLYRDGRMETKKWGTYSVKEILDADPWQVWSFGPALLDENGEPMTIYHRLAYPNPRAAIGYFEPGHYCFVVVDGRGESFGISLNNLSILMHDLGCVAAYNLDGGASAQMYWNGAIVNTPSNTNRAVSDIIYLLAEE